MVQAQAAPSGVAAAQPVQAAAALPPLAVAATPLLPSPPSPPLIDLQPPHVSALQPPQIPGPPYPHVSFQGPLLLPSQPAETPPLLALIPAPQPTLPGAQPQPTLAPPGTKKQAQRASIPYSRPRTRRRAKKLNEEESETEEEGHHLLPLREVPTAPGIIGFINLPINTGDVRAFKKEMGRLMDDPFGVAERLDKFLGTSIYSFEDINSILRSLFNTEEREMIRQAGIREWECQNPQGITGDQKWPSQDPRWNAQSKEGRRNIVDLRNIVIQGIREAVPRGQNISKVFGECQERDETPTEWLDRLRKSLQVYSRTDPNSPVGEMLLKTQFVAKS
ncbi:hypothetical protein HGM15179_019633 [Zosterops borbonicus]|uniref:Core shell protein Gag P30 domain-containing protein n=1 Tax=Zosterops borbonicus TaxID=364589 RepID=A0A8K1DB23_9PASS|nr:hypothetical protein HGM15179_019633 [Zosterops borbonicus]